MKQHDLNDAKKTPLLAIVDGAIGYGGNPMFSGINLDICEGAFWGLIGPNGAGKSTLLKTLLGVIPPLAGRVTRCKDLVVGYVPQRAAIDAIYPFSALEVVRSGALGHPRGLRGSLSRLAPVDKSLKVLTGLGVAPLAHRAFRDLSGGERQRVLVARGLVRNPNLLILDEPTAGMDLPAERELLDIITRLNRESSIAVLMVVHQISLVVGRAKHLALLNQKQARFQAAAADEILTASALSSLYGHPMSVVDGPEGTPLVVAGQTVGGVS